MPLASVYPLVATRSLARVFTYEVPAGVGKGAVVALRSEARPRGGVVVETGVDAPPGIEPRAGRARARRAAARPRRPRPLPAAYYGTTPARARARRRYAGGRAASARPRRSGKRLLGEAEPDELTSDQAAAVASVVAALDGGGHVLLAGPTGSGKTEVYLQAAAAAPNADAA